MEKISKWDCAELNSWSVSGDFPAQPINTGVAGFLAAVFSGRMAKNFFPPQSGAGTGLNSGLGGGGLRR